MLTDIEPMCATRGYRVHLHNGWLIDLQAEGIWPMGTQLEWTITTLVIGLPRQVVVQRCHGADVDLVLRDDGEVWPPLVDIPSCLMVDPASHFAPAGPDHRGAGAGVSGAHRVRSFRAFACDVASPPLHTRPPSRSSSSPG